VDDKTAEASVLQAAGRLFNEIGIRAVGMDQIRDAAGVSLKRLYQLFPAKDHLIGAVLRRREEAFLRSLTTHVGSVADPAEKILAVFDYLHSWFGESDYRGCPFINAFGELGATSPTVAAAVEEQKRNLERFLSDLAVAADAPASLGEQLLILANGAMVTAAIHRSPEPATQARTAAQLLLNAARQAHSSPGGARRPPSTGHGQH
jgi:AcrR family transcriptional regulator